MKTLQNITRTIAVALSIYALISTNEAKAQLNEDPNTTSTTIPELGNLKPEDQILGYYTKSNGERIIVIKKAGKGIIHLPISPGGRIKGAEDIVL